MKKNLIITIAVFLSVLATKEVSASCNNGEMVCGDNCCATLDANGVLTISGSGNMYDFDYSEEYDGIYHGDLKNPFRLNDAIKSIKFAEGSNITSIGKNTFYQIPNLTSIEIPDSVTSIGEYAFTYSGLSSIEIPDSVTKIGYQAFAYNQLASVDFSGTSELSHGSFLYNPLISITVPDSFSIGNLSAVFGSLDVVNNLQINCRGSVDSCQTLKDNLKNYLYDYENNLTIDLSDKVVLAKDDKCNSAKYYYNGSECIKEPDVTKRTCEYNLTGYIKVGDYCYSPEVTYAKKHYTPAEANQWLKDDDNFVVLTFKK